MSVVGILVLDRVRLTIMPKFAIGGPQLTEWLCYALGTPIPHQSAARRWLTDRAGFADLIVAALVMECRTLLLGGLRRDYLRRDVVEPVMRGRLNIGAQIARRYGQVDRLHVRTFDRDVEIWENLACGAALAQSVRLATNADLARTAAATAALFPRPSRPTGMADALERARYTRLNSRYRRAHAWAGLILRGGGVADLLIDEGLRADSLLINMDSLWEAVVRRAISEAVLFLDCHVVAPGGERAVSASGDIGSTSTFRPDVLVQRTDDHEALMAVDAKYKRYDREPVSAADTHQMLTYIAGYSHRPPASSCIRHPRAASSGHCGSRGPEVPSATFMWWASIFECRLRTRYHGLPRSWQLSSRPRPCHVTESCAGLCRSSNLHVARRDDRRARRVSVSRRGLTVCWS
jgi:5-methylcytosine-specific restriction enzyme subunit McrC